MQAGFLHRLLQRLRGSGGEPLVLNLKAPVQVSPHPKIPELKPVRKPEPYPGNFLSFDFLIEIKIGGSVHIGYPKLPLRDMLTREVRWGTKAKVMSTIPWVDDPERGFTGRVLAGAEDALGAEGTLSDKRLRFERILNLGEGVVVYAIHCPAENFRMAYGFNRDVFEPGYVSPAMERILALTAEKQIQTFKIDPGVGPDQVDSINPNEG
jgi:hypothetical protein